MTLNPSNYSREGTTNTPTIHTRYAGECPTCETHVQATPKRNANAHDPTIWVRCSCGQITRYEQTGSTDR